LNKEYGGETSEKAEEQISHATKKKEKPRREGSKWKKSEGEKKEEKIFS